MENSSNLFANDKSNNDLSRDLDAMASVNLHPEILLWGRKFQGEQLQLARLIEDRITSLTSDLQSTAASIYQESDRVTNSIKKTEEVNEELSTVKNYFLSEIRIVAQSTYANKARIAALEAREIANRSELASLRTVVQRVLQQIGGLQAGSGPSSATRIPSSEMHTVGESSLFK